MKRLLLLLPIAIFSGCLLKEPIKIQPALANQNANEDINAVKAELTNQMNRLEKMFEEVKLSAQATPTAQAGANNRSENIQAENVTKTVTNDTDLMKYVVYAYLTIVLGLIVFMTKQMKTLELEKKFYKDLLLSTSVKDEKQLAEVRRAQEVYKKSGGKLNV